MGINVGTAIAFLELDMSNFKNGLSSAGADLKNFATGGGLQNLSSAMSTTGSELTKSVTLPLAGVGAAAVKTSMDFEAQMSKVAAISGATGGDLKGLRDQAIKLGADTNFSASEAAEGMELFASAGFKVNDIMASMGGVLDTAAAGGVSIAQATDVAASSLNGFGLAASAENVNHIGDVLAKLAGDTNAEILDTGEAMKYVAPVSKALGISFEDTAASIGLLSNAGIKGSQAGTTLRSALTNLAAPTDSAAALMQRLGLNFFDSEGKMKSMTDILTELKDKTAGLTQQEKASAMETLFGKEAMSGMLAMVDQGPEKFDELSKSLRDCDGASKEMAGVMSNNLKGAMNAMEGSLETAAIKIGDVLAPMIKSAATWIGDMANKFSALPQPMQELIVKVGLIAAALGPVLIILAKLIESVRTVASVFTGLRSAATVFTALPGIMNPPVLIILAIIGAIAAIVYVVMKNWDTLKEYFGNFFAWLKSIFGGFFEWLKNFFSQWGPTILAIIAPFLGIPLIIWQHWSKVKEWLQPVFDWLISAFDKVVSFFTNGIDGIKMAFDDFKSWASGIGENICKGLVSGLEAGWDWVFEKVGNMADKIKSIFTKILDIHSPSRVFRGYGINILEGLVGGIDKEEGSVNAKFGNLANKIKGLGNVVPEFSNISTASLGGSFGLGKSAMSYAGPRSLNIDPKIDMHITLSDTGNKGTAELTNELKGMTRTSLKNGLVDEFMSDAFRL
jgi:TP901 family phage tail tape measure protein